MITEDFNQEEFSRTVNEELAYSGMGIANLAERIYSGKSALGKKLSNKLKFTEEEVKRIKKVFNIN